MKGSSGRSSGPELLSGQSGEVKSGLDLLRPTEPTIPTVESPKVEENNLDFLQSPTFTDTIQGRMMRNYFTGESIVPEQERPIRSEVPQIGMPMDQSLWQKFLGWFHNPTVGRDRAANIVNMSELTGLSPTEVLRHYEELSDVFFPARYPSSRKLAVKSLQGAMSGAIVGGLMTAPVVTATTVAAFMGVDEAVNAFVSWKKEEPYLFQEGKGFSDLLEAEGFSRDAIDVLEFITEAGIAGGVSSAGRDTIGALLRGAGDKVGRVNIINRIAKRAMSKNISPGAAAEEIAKEGGLTEEAIQKAKVAIDEVKAVQKDLAEKEALRKFEEKGDELVRLDIARRSEEIARAKQLKPKIGEREKELRRLKKEALAPKEELPIGREIVERRAEVRPEVDRRVDFKLRKQVSEMSREEIEKAFLTDELTGLPNRSAWERAPIKEKVVSLDLDKMKKMNDVYGEEVGDLYLQHAARGFKESDATVYRLGGDDFVAKGNTKAEIDTSMRKVKKWFDENPLRVETDKGSVEVKVGFSYGVGKDIPTSFKTMKKAKEAAIKKGEVEERYVKPEKGDVKSIENEVGVRYEGVQEGVSRNIQLWTDMESKSTFSTNKIDLGEVREKVKRLRPDEPKTEVDLQTGTREPISLDEAFNEPLEHALNMKKVYEGHEKALVEDPEMFMSKLINDVNLWRGGEEVPIEKVRNGLSELASRSEELRSLFMESESYPFNFDSWKEVVEEAAVWARRADRSKIKGSEGTKLYSGIPLDKAAEEVIAGARRLSEYTRKARGVKAFKPGRAAKMLKEEGTRAFVDRSGNIRERLLQELDEDGYRAMQSMYLSRGASALAASKLKQMRKEVYRGLSKDEKRILDNLILADRMIDIGKYKTEKQFKFPEGLTPADSVAYRELFQHIEKITPEAAEELLQRAETYFEWMKKPLDDMLEAQLISKEEHADLSAHNYRRIKLVDIYDKRYVTKIGKKKRTVYDSGVQALSRGRGTDVYEPSSEIMALEVFNRAYGRVLNNKANLELLDIAKKYSDNPFVAVKETGKIPTGWQRIFVYENGQRRAIYLSPEMGKEWITNNPEMSYQMSQLLRWSSGSPVLRTFATGINWGFALANLPRDVMHTWYTARKFEGGKWKSVYSPHLPAFTLQIGRDLGTVFTDSLLRKGRYDEYINEGGGMEFLVHQGRLFQRGRHLEKPLDKIFNFLGYLGETSELMTRLAIRERMLRQGKSPQEATFAARDYMDFGQGGGFTKAADNALPYLNAGVQGTRGLLRSFKPGSGTALSSTYKLAQFATLVTGTYIAARKLAPMTMKALQGNTDMQNNLCIPLGDEFSFEDSEGQTRYVYLKIPLDPGQKFFKTFFEAATDKWLGNEIDVNRVVDSLKEQSPVGVGELPPSISGLLGYVTNKDFWMNEDIWRQTEQPFSWPQSNEEYIPGETPQIYVDVGKATGLSPERTRYVVEELTTSGTLWSYLLGKGYQEVFGDLPKDEKEMHLAETLAKTAVIKRFFGITNPYSQYAKGVNEAQEKVELERWVQNRGLDLRAQGYLFGDSYSRKEVVDYIKSFKDKKVFDRLKSDFEFQEKTKDLPNRTFWLRMKRLPPEARAKVYVDRLNASNEAEKEQLRKELAIVIRGGGVISKEFRLEVSKLH